MFDAASELTVGVEEELTTVDPQTLAQAPAVDRVVELADGDARFVRCSTSSHRPAQRLGVEARVLTAHALLLDNRAERQRAVASVHGIDGLLRRLVRETVGSAEDFLMQRA